MVSRVSSPPLVNNIMIDPAVSSVSHLLETRHGASEALTLFNVPRYYPFIFVLLSYLLIGHISLACLIEA